MKKRLLSLLILSAGSVFAQQFVSTTPQNRKVILEKFTGINCVFCPQGETVANTIRNNNPGNVFLINIHQGGFATPGGGQPDFRTSFGNAIAGQTGLTGYPAGTVNRTVFTGLSMTAGGTAMGRNNWTNAANQILSQSSYVNVAAQANINVQTRAISVTVETFYTANSPVATNKLNVALLQNNTLGPQTGGNLGDNYNHQHRLIHMISGQWGSDITTTTQGSLNTQTFNYNIPEALNGVPIEIGELEVVVFVAETQQRIISGNQGTITYSGLAANDVSLRSIGEIGEECNTSISPKVRIQNLSQTAITSLPINYTINGGTPQIFNWTGNLAPMATQQVTLPATSYTLLPVNIVNVNLNGDDNNNNNVGEVEFNKSVETEFSNITIQITTDQYGSETTWRLRNSAGTIVSQGGPYTDLSAAGTVVRPAVNVTLPNDCYSFEISDSYGDGMCCAYGNGGYEIKANNVTLTGLTGGDFGSGETRKLLVNNILSNPSFEVAAIKFYPNPTTGVVAISSPFSAEMTINDLSGKTVYNSKIESGDSSINLSNLSKGIYVIQFEGENYSKTEKLIIK